MNLYYIWVFFFFKGGSLSEPFPLKAKRKLFENDDDPTISILQKNFSGLYRVEKYPGKYIVFIIVCVSK